LLPRPSSLAIAAATLALTPAVAIALTSPANAADYSQIFSFGDSLVDTGNAFSLTESLIGTGIPPEPYFEGRFANGPLWSEYLASELELPLTNFGFGGAFSGREASMQLGGPIPGLELPGLLTQVDEFTASSAVDPDALYLVSSGANDYLSGGVINPQQPVADIAEALRSLQTAGAQHIVVANQPPLGDLPVANRADAPPGTNLALNQLSDAHNQGLAVAVESLTTTGVDIDLLDINSLVRDAQAGAFGIENSANACILTPACVFDPSVQAQTLFWDEIHPTTQIHLAVAEAALAQLQDKQIPESPVTTPEPGLFLGLFALGGALAAVRRRETRADYVDQG